MVKPGFKQTEVGKIPEDWEAKPLSSVCSMKSGEGITNARIKDGDKFPCYGGNGLRGYTNRFTHEGSYALIGRQGALCGNVNGVTGQFFASEHAIVVTPSPNTNIDWLTYVLGRMNLNQYSESSAQPGLSVTKLLPLNIAVPIHKDEQKAIAKALSDVDELIVSLEKLIAKKRDIKTATMQQLLTGKTRLPGFAGKWNLIRIETDANLKARIGWQALTTKEYLDSGSFYLVTGTDFVDGRVNWSTCHFVDEWRYSQDRNIQLKNGDVLLTKDGTIGKVGYVEHLELPATLNSGVFVIRPLNNKFDPLFLYYILSSRVFEDFLNKITAGSTITHLYQKDFVNFEFQAPEVDEQKEIALVLDATDAELSGYIEKLEKTKSIKQGMMQELLTGRTRLVDVPSHQVDRERLHGT